MVGHGWVGRFFPTKKNVNTVFSQVSRLLFLFLLCLSSYYLGKRPNVVITDIELLKQVFVKEFNSFPNREVRLL